jgi:hypothetical protein
MASPRKKKRKTVDGKQLRDAVTLVLLGSPGGTKISAQAASEKFESLNRNRVTAAVKDIKSAAGDGDRSEIEAKIAEQTGGNAGRFETTFTEDEEKVIVAVAIRMDLLGFGMTKAQFCGWCRDIAKKKGYKGAKCDRHWFDGFMKRGKGYDENFGIGKRGKLDVKRAQKHSAPVFDKFFDLVKALYAKLFKDGVLKTAAPEDWQIFNVDELHSDPEKKYDKVVGHQKRKRKSKIASGDRFPFHVTVTLTTCADGSTTTPPQVIHKGKRMTQKVLDGVPDDWAVWVSPNASQDQVGFDKWCTHFASSVRKIHTDIDVPLFLFLDGHSSRWTMSGLQTLLDAGIYALCLPSHTSALSQPNDNGPNRKWHKLMAALMSVWRMQHTGMVVQVPDVNKMNATSWKQLKLEGKIIVNAFERTGLFPLNRDASNYSAENLTIAEGVSPDASVQVADQALRKAHSKEFVVFKQSDDAGSGGGSSGSLVLHAEVAKNLTVNFAKSAQEIAALKAERKVKSKSGIPNTYFGACITAGEFMHKIGEYQSEKTAKLTAAAEKAAKKKEAAAAKKAAPKGKGNGKGKGKGKGKAKAKGKKRKQAVSSDDEESDEFHSEDELEFEVTDVRGTTARTRGSAQTDDYDSDDDSEEDENEVLDRTKKPPVPQGFHVVAAQDAKSMVEEDDWADELEGGATHMVTRFDVEAEDVDCDGGGAGASQQLWYTGSDLRSGVSEDSTNGLCLSYDDGDDACHVDAPSMRTYGKSWYLLAEDE